MNEREGRVKGSEGFALWVPVAVGTGTGTWFALPFEPPISVLIALVAIAVSGLWVSLKSGRFFIVASILFLVSLGAAAAGLRAAYVAAPVLAEPLEMIVKGRVTRVDRSRSGYPRITLDNPDLTGTALPPARVRITLTRSTRDSIKPGDIIRVKARLAPPGSPVSPGSYNFARAAWFNRLGAIGYTRSVPEILGHEPGGMAEIRTRISATIRARLDEHSGGVAAALAVGDRSAITTDVEQALRDAGLAHLLAISGLHMGLVVGLVFLGLRTALVLVPGLAERSPIKKIAATGALLAAIMYLVLSGAAISTQRAFIMAAVALIAVIIDRPAITFRGLAAAATLLLLIRPESLISSGFQMSFAAATALVAVYGTVATRHAGRERGLARHVLIFFAASALTSLVAGLASGPFAAWHFHRAALYGLPANLLAVPITSLWIMPMLIIAGVLTPFGLSGIALEIAGAGIRAVIAIAKVIAVQPNAVELVAAGTNTALVAIVAGGLILCLVSSYWRFTGLAPVAVGVLLWAAAPRPDVLVSKSGALIAVRGQDGKLDLSQTVRDSFTARIWLDRDGDGTKQVDAAARSALFCRRKTCEGLSTHGWRIRSRGAAATQKEVTHLCREKTILILPAAHMPQKKRPCIVVDQGMLKRTGGMALFIHGNTVRLKPALSGSRYWSQ